jgi:hypothetical protein
VEVGGSTTRSRTQQEQLVRKFLILIRIPKICEDCESLDTPWRGLPNFLADSAIYSS